MCFRIRKAKTEEHFKPMHPVLKNFFILIWDHLPDTGKLVKITYHSISQGFKRAQHKAGLTRRGATHIFRHSIATNVESLEDAKYILGHESVTTSEIYRHIIDKKMKDRFKQQEL
jgi:site-specific recombinase XerD